ncbi:hypothetical protein [Herpetosiphon sp. NSE202]|uniref:hypothetical protein n=1 Tax=Herpetosiphon sp. NSE202 TaxID=3351349 RepID=UPI003625F34A
MKYFYLLVVCLMLASCETATPQPTSIPLIEPVIQQKIEQTAEQILGHSKINDVVIHEIPGLERDRLFVFLFQASEGLMIGSTSGWHDQTQQEFHTKGLSIDGLTPMTDPFISQVSIENEPFYLVYGYMPSRSAQLAKIFLKNGDVFYFAAGSGLQARLLFLANPAVKVEFVDNADQVILEHQLHSK